VVFATIARADEAEQTVTFIANSGSEQEMIFLPRGSARGEAQSPQAVDGYRCAKSVVQLADKSAARKIEDANVTVTEIAYEEMTAGGAETSRGESKSPGRIQSAL
jgi:hypothetical protein